MLGSWAIEARVVVSAVPVPVVKTNARGRTGEGRRRKECDIGLLLVWDGRNGAGHGREGDGVRRRPASTGGEGRRRKDRAGLRARGADGEGPLRLEVGPVGRGYQPLGDGRRVGYRWKVGAVVEEPPSVDG